MGSKDDMHDVIGLNYDDDDGYYSGDHYDDDDNDDVEGDGRRPEQQRNYTVLSEADVRRLQEEDIASTCAVLSVSRASACILLLHHNWSVGKLQDAWFTDEESVRKAVGLLRPSSEQEKKKPGVETSGPDEETTTTTCGICFDSYTRNGTSSAACGHLFCVECWRGYIRAAVGDGRRCLTLRCPEPSCGTAVGSDVIDRLAGADEHREKYSRFLLTSYVECSRNLKWCPAPGCEFVLECDGAGGSSSSYDVFCRCSNGFCWNCGEEAHRPVDCATVAEWKNGSEARNTEWILANCKLCPMCRRPIEKDMGCTHMVCPCWFDFCWLCLGDWSNHDESSCNIGYDTDRKKVSLLGEEGRKRETAEKSLDRYVHYYERWEANHASRKKALDDLRALQGGRLQKLVDKYGPRESRIGRVVTEAWQQVAECRGVLKWSYAYGYHLLQDKPGKKEFFDYLQGEAERRLELLLRCVEKDIKVFLGGRGRGRGDSSRHSGKEFDEFLTKLDGLTSVTRNYFENLLQALEGGLEDVTGDGRAACSTSAGAGGEGSSRARAARTRGATWWRGKLVRWPRRWHA